MTITTILSDTAQLSTLQPWLRNELQRAVDRLNELESERDKLRAELTHSQSCVAVMREHSGAVESQVMQLLAERDQLRAEVARLAAPKMAPVQGYAPGIPWEMHMRAYAVYCNKYRPQQELIEGGCRGGFGTCELDEFIPGWRDELSELTKLRAELAQLSDYNEKMVDSYTSTINVLRAEVAKLRAPKKRMTREDATRVLDAYSGFHGTSTVPAMFALETALAAHWGVELEGK